MKDWSNVKCCLCGQPLWNGRAIVDSDKNKYFGNSPWPLSTNEEDRCCDKCDDLKVIPERIRQIFNAK